MKVTRMLLASLAAAITVAAKDRKVNSIEAKEKVGKTFEGRWGEDWVRGVILSWDKEDGLHHALYEDGAIEDMNLADKLAKGTLRWVDEAEDIDSEKEPTGSARHQPPSAGDQPAPEHVATAGQATSTVAGDTTATGQATQRCSQTATVAVHAAMGAIEARIRLDLELFKLGVEDGGRIKDRILADRALLGQLAGRAWPGLGL